MEDSVNPPSAKAAAASTSSVTRNREVELKLLVPPGQLEELEKLPVLARHTRNRGVFRKLESVYYDTPDRQLFRNNISLRVRRSGKTFIQTLKRPTADLDPLARYEWEVAVPDLAPNLELLPPEAIETGLSGVADIVLEPVFAVKVRRHSQVLALPDASIELAYDQGVIEAGSRCEPICELEIELKHGEPALVYEIALSLLESVPVRIGTQAKADRGYLLAQSMQARSVKANKTAIRPEDNIDQIIVELLGECRQHMLANQAAVEAGDLPEGVHQMRVALRRMRTALSILRKQTGSTTLSSLAMEAKWLAQALGAVRNWDVLATDTVSGIEAGCPDSEAFDALRTSIAPHRHSGYDDLRKIFRGERYNHFVLTLGYTIERRSWRNDIASESLGILAETARDFGARTLHGLHRRSLKKGKNFKRLSPESQHELRLILKKLRYTAEFFRNVFDRPAQAQRYLERLAELQDHLGLANDAATTGSLLAVLVQDPAAGHHLHRGAGLVTGWQARDRQTGADELFRTWKRFAHATEFWQG